MLLHNLASARDDWRLSGKELLDQRLNLFARTWIEFKLQLVAGRKKLLVLEGVIKGFAEGRNPILRNTGRRDERTTEFELTKEQLKNRAMICVFDEVPDHRDIHLVELGVTFHAELNDDVGFAFRDPVRGLHGNVCILKAADAFDPPRSKAIIVSGEPL